jgi:hypothetical protein
VAGQVAGVDGAGRELGLAQDADQQVPVGDHAVQPGPGQRPGQYPAGVVAGAPEPDDLGQHRVVERADPGAGREARVDPEPRGAVEIRGGNLEGGHVPADRQVAGRDVLGVQAGLDGMAGEGGPGDLGRQRVAGRHLQLDLDQVQAGDQLGDRVLDLEPGVDLEEPEPARGVQHELDRARAHVADGPARGHRGPAQFRAQLGTDRRGRGLLDDLLVATLDRALALEQVDHGPGLVAEDLDLDVPGSFDEAFQEDGAVAERRGRLAAGAGHGLGHLGRVVDDPHAAPAAAERRLDQDRIADLVGRLGQLGRVGLGAVVEHRAGQDRDPGRGHDLLGADLRAHGLDGFGAGADEGQPGRGAGPGEARVLGQEAVARVHAACPGGGGRGQQRPGVQVGVGRGRAGQPDRLVGVPDERQAFIGVREHRDRGQVHGPGGAHDPGRDLAPVGDQQLAQRRVRRHVGPHIRKTPKPRRPATGPECTADSAMPSTERVSRGSMTPSS